MKERLKKALKNILKVCAVILAAALLEVFFVRPFHHLPKTDSDFTASRDYSLENAIEPVPDEYLQPVENGGRIEELNYKTETTEKRAIIYLPPGYDENKKYDIIYFQGGANSTETSYFGTPKKPKPKLINILDNLIIKGKIKPVIAVCANFYNKSRSDTDITELSNLYQSYSSEVRKCLIPAIESVYSTYAESVSDEDIVASRGHRGFGGYSMGAAITWNIFINNLDCFYYYMPNCGGLQNPYVPHLSTNLGERLNNAVESMGYTTDDYFIYSAVGTLDITYNSTKCLITNLYKDYDKNFIFTQDNTKNGNITFKRSLFKLHSFDNAITNFYNALPALFPAE